MFSLDTWTMAKVTHINKRVENHCQELVHAMDINWTVDGANKMLDLIHPSIRAAIYRAVGTMPIPGVEESTPELASELIESPYNLKYEGSGYLLSVKFGEVSGDQIELAGSEIDKFKVDAKQGGSIVLHFRSRHSGLSRDMLGVISSIDGKEVSLLAAPPALQTGVVPEKKGGKKKPEDTATTPFKFSVQAEGGIVDNNPQKTDSEMAEAATQALIDSAKPAAKKTAKKDPEREAERAKRFPSAAKKVASKKTKSKPH